MYIKLHLVYPTRWQNLVLIAAVEHCLHHLLNCTVSQTALTSDPSESHINYMCLVVSRSRVLHFRVVPVKEGVGRTVNLHLGEHDFCLHVCSRRI